MPVGGGKAWPDTPAPHQAPAVGRAPLEPEGLLIQAAVPVGGGKAWPGFEIDHSEPLGSRVAISRAGRRPRVHQAATQQGWPLRRPENSRAHSNKHSNRHSNSHNNKHNNGGAATGLRPRSCPSARSPTRLQLGAFEAEDVEELARTIR